MAVQIQDVNRGSDSFIRISRSLIERPMELRCQTYLAGAKHRLLLQTIMELDRFSEINKGSTFTLTLPLSVDAENPHNSQ